MEYLDGEPLDALIDRDRQICRSPTRCRSCAAIAKALDAAHAKGIAHRDLKAENMFLATDPTAAACCRSCSTSASRSCWRPRTALKHKTRTGAPIGTPYYMSPEQCRGRDVDHRTDIYAFGVLAYLMLTGVYPFDGDDYMSILMQQINDAPEPPSVHLPELPPAIDDVDAWLLAKDPAERPPDLRDRGARARASRTRCRHRGTGDAVGIPARSACRARRRSRRWPFRGAVTRRGRRGADRRRKAPATTQRPVAPKSRASLLAVIAGAAVARDRRRRAS